MKKLRGNGSSISVEKFISTWQTSNSLQEIADKLKISRQAVNQRGYIYRRHGVKLKRMMPKPRIDWKKMRQLADKFIAP